MQSYNGRMPTFQQQFFLIGDDFERYSDRGWTHRNGGVECTFSSLLPSVKTFWEPMFVRSPYISHDERQLRMKKVREEYSNKLRRLRGPQKSRTDQVGEPLHDLLDIRTKIEGRFGDDICHASVLHVRFSCCGNDGRSSISTLSQTSDLL